MTTLDVERRIFGYRRALALFGSGLWVLSLAAVLASIWTGDTRWLGTGAVLGSGGCIPLYAYLVIRTPRMVPYMVEQYRIRGVEIDDKASP